MQPYSDDILSTPKLCISQAVSNVSKACQAYPHLYPATVCQSGLHSRYQLVDSGFQPRHKHLGACMASQRVSLSPDAWSSHADLAKHTALLMAMLLW